jgi:hypothetical protein
MKEETYTYTKEEIIAFIKSRILEEHMKHSEKLDWARIAAGKIYATLSEAGVIVNKEE